MGKLFDLDSPVMRFLSRMADVIILNILVMITCIPFITVGASLSAMHYVLIKMVRNEDNYIFKMYFKAFKNNFKQGTILWLIQSVVITIFVADIYIMTHSQTAFSGVIVVAVVAIAAIFIMASMYIYPLQARFINSVGATFKNSFFIMILNLPKSVLMILVYALPILLFFFGQSYSIPFIIMFGISGPGLAAAYLYRKVFKRFEPDDSEEITSDLDFSISVEDEEDVEEDERTN